MIKIGDTLISDDVMEVRFCCDLCKCQGECCVEGDAGAPLDQEEIGILEDCVEEVKPYMTPEGVKVIEKVGVYEYDCDGDLVTPLVNNAECAFVYSENGITWCAIEKAWKEGKIDFRKPISCHLYPIRIVKYNGFDALNYHQWPICNVALENKDATPLYLYLKEPLIRKYGTAWYEQLKTAGDEYLKEFEQL